MRHLGFKSIQAHLQEIQQKITKSKLQKQRSNNSFLKCFSWLLCVFISYIKRDKCLLYNFVNWKIAHSVHAISKIIDQSKQQYILMLVDNAVNKFNLDSYPFTNNYIIMQIKQLSPNFLPIARHLPKIVELIQINPVVVISGKTGCGKSTQVPKAIWKHNPKAKIAVCQPRRVAATSLAARVAAEVGCKIGSNVGYHIGMQSFKSENCSIIYMTYGILIQQLLFKQELPYTHIVLDQIHQRSLQMDFSFVALKNLMNQRKQQNKSISKLIIMSATLNSKQFANYFATNVPNGLFFIPIIKVKQNQQSRQKTGRGTRNRQNQIQNFQRTEMDQKYIEAAMYDIPQEKIFKVEQIFWKGKDLFNLSAEQEPRLTDQIISQALALMQKIKNEKSIQGDILFFLPGYFQIQAVKTKLLQIKVNAERIVEVHSIFSQQLYEKLFLSKIENKLILATNIGESSITLPFCNIVIDFCLTKKNTTKQKGINQLETRFASKASLTQRGGRVGRVANGYVFRMITEQFYQTLPSYQQPQIKCISLQMVILRAKQLDFINNSKIFADPYCFLLGVMNPPNIETIRSSIQHLIQQQALLGPGAKIQQANQLQLTKIGQFMVSMPCDMQISKMILMSIKLRIPGLVVAIASIMIATKMFFAHQQRRENIEQFMHSLIGYDSGYSNDYLLRERIYNHWKKRFYQPIKEKRLLKRRISNNQNNQNNEKEISRKYELDQQEAQETGAFLQQFCQQKWSQAQKDFCFPRGLNLMSMRQVIKIQQSLRLRLKNLGVAFNLNEKRNINLFLLCLTYAFPDYSCQINYTKYIKNYKKDLKYVQFPMNWEVTDKMIDKYIDPEKEYQTQRKQRTVRIYGVPKVLKKFIFPQYFNKNSIKNNVSELFENLARQKISNKFQCDIVHKFFQVVVLNESVNRVLILDDYQKNYRLLTHQISMSNNRKLVKMCGIIDQQTHLLIQLITNKNVEVSLHPSRQFLNSFRVAGINYNFKRLISEDELNVIKNLRNVAIRKNTTSIHSSQQVMSQKDIQTLLHFLQTRNMNTRQHEPWQHIFISQNYSIQNQKHYPLTFSFQFNNNKTFQKDYLKWKEKQYYKFMKLYRPLILEEYYIICAQCRHHIQMIEHVTFYEPQKNILRLNQFSGNWIQKKNDLCCAEGHVIGKIKQDGQTSVLNIDKLEIYEPCNKRILIWKQWPSKEDLITMTQRSKIQVQEFRKELNEFECPFCFEKNQDYILKHFSKFEHGPSFWKKLQQHLRSQSHLNSFSQFKKSLRKKQ